MLCAGTDRLKQPEVHSATLWRRFQRLEVCGTNNKEAAFPASLLRDVELARSGGRIANTSAGNATCLQGLLTLTRLLQSRLFSNGCVARKKLVSAYVQYALAQFFSCVLPLGKKRLFAGGILVVTGLNPDWGQRMGFGGFNYTIPAGGDIKKSMEAF